MVEKQELNKSQKIALRLLNDGENAWKVLSALMPIDIEDHPIIKQSLTIGMSRFFSGDFDNRAILEKFVKDF